MFLRVLHAGLILTTFVQFSSDCDVTNSISASHIEVILHVSNNGHCYFSHVVCYVCADSGQTGTVTVPNSHGINFRMHHRFLDKIPNEIVS